VAWWLIGTAHLKPKGDNMIDLEWIKTQGAPSWAQHIAKEVHTLQRELFGSEHQPPAAASPAPTPPAPPEPPTTELDDADEGDDENDDGSGVPGATGDFVPPFNIKA
jgi:hypothetical protein